MRKIAVVLILLVLISACSSNHTAPPVEQDNTSSEGTADEGNAQAVEDSLNEQLIPENEDIDIGDMI